MRHSDRRGSDAERARILGVLCNTVLSCEERVVLLAATCLAFRGGARTTFTDAELADRVGLDVGRVRDILVAASGPRGPFRVEESSRC